MASLALFLLVAGVSMLTACEARHIHVKQHHQRDNPEDVWDRAHESKEKHMAPAAAARAGEDTDELAPIDIINNVRPVWFVPINSKYFFGIKEPCEGGYKRDRFGICREVWD